MKSERWHKLTKTFRFRLAVQFTVMVTLALCATCLIALVAVKTLMRKSAHQHLYFSLRQARATYVGKKMGEKSEQLPEDVLNRLKEQFPNLHIGMIEEESQPGGMLFEVLASTGKEWLEILADPDGEIWVADRKPLEEVFATMQEIIQAEMLDDFNSVLCSPNTELLAGTFHGDLTQAKAEELMHMQGLEEEFLIIEKGDDLFSCATLFDGNMLLVAGSREKMKETRVFSISFFALLLITFIPLSTWIGFRLSCKAMADVRNVTMAAQKIEQTGNFEKRATNLCEGTEIRELVDTFNTMVSRVEVLTQELKDVITNVAHDLKTPLMRIRGFIEGSEWEENSRPKRELMLASAIEECDRVVPLINMIMEISRADAGMLELQQEPFNLAEEVHNAYKIFSSIAEDHAIHFECHTTDQPVPIIGDQQRMQRIIANILDNALKYTPEGGRVLLKLNHDEETATLTVQDNGIGIPPEKQERVFERFYRINQSRTWPGHGLGLSLVKAFVTAWGGTVRIDSDVGTGCSVTIQLPRGNERVS